MNFFNTMGRFLVGGLDVNSLAYINKSNLSVVYNTSGGTELVDYISYGSSAIGLNVNDTNSTFVALENQNNGALIRTSDLLQDPFKGFSVYMKYKLRDNHSNQVFSQYSVSNPVVQLFSSHTEINRGDQLQITVFQNGYTDLSYEITGVTSANLNGADVSGPITDLYTVLSYDIQPGIQGGALVFVAGDASLNISTYPTYFVKTVENVVGQTVFALKPPGQTEFFVQPDLSFNAGDMFMFDVSDPTMNGFNLVFGTTMDVSNSVIPEVVSVDGSTIILDISAGYTGGALYYFEDTSAGMGYGEIESDPFINPPNSQRSYSSVYPNESGFVGNNSELGLTGDIIWHANYPDLNQWMKIDIGSTVKVVATRTEGRYNHFQRVTKYTVEYSLDDIIYLQVDGGAEMIGNVVSNNDIVDAYFITPVIARYIKFRPTEWVHAIGMAAGLIIAPPSTYTVTVSGDPDVFYIDETPQPNLTFTAGETYVFDQSNPLNTGNQLVLGTVPDLSSSMISYQTVVGTPGQPGAYTSFTATEETVYYFSYETPVMGFAPPTYTVQIGENDGNSIILLQGPGESGFTSQPDLSFNPGDDVYFNVSDPSIIGYQLVFMTDITSYGTIESNYTVTENNIIRLNLTDYTGQSLIPHIIDQSFIAIDAAHTSLQTYLVDEVSNGTYTAQYKAFEGYCSLKGLTCSCFFYNGGPQFYIVPAQNRIFFAVAGTPNAEIRFIAPYNGFCEVKYSCNLGTTYVKKNGTQFGTVSSPNEKVSITPVDQGDTIAVWEGGWAYSRFNYIYFYK